MEQTVLEASQSIKSFLDEISPNLQRVNRYLPNVRAHTTGFFSALKQGVTRTTFYEYLKASRIQEVLQETFSVTLVEEYEADNILPETESDLIAAKNTDRYGRTQAHHDLLIISFCRKRRPRRINSFKEASWWVLTNDKKLTFWNQRNSGVIQECIVPEGTPTEVIEHRLSDEERLCTSCGAMMEEIGKEVHRSLQMEPAKFWIREDVYYTYACKQCEETTGEANILKTPKEPVLYPGSFASAEAVAHIMTQKFVMYSPLYRLEQEFNREGLKLTRQTMANWMLNTSDTWLRPIYEVLHRKLCAESVLHGDETTLRVLKESGKAATSKSFPLSYSVLFSSLTL